MLSSPSASPSRRPTAAAAAAAAKAQTALAPGPGHGKPRLWPPPSKSTHPPEWLPSSTTTTPPTGPTASPHALVRAVLDLNQHRPAAGGADHADDARGGHGALRSVSSHATLKEPVIRLGPSPRAPPPPRPTPARRPALLNGQQQAPGPTTPTGTLVTGTGAVAATADAVILPHHGHPHCSSTESGSPLVGVGMATGYHWHRPIALRELVSSLSPSPSPAHSPAPQPSTQLVPSPPPPPPQLMQPHQLLNPVHVHSPPHLLQARPQQHTTAIYRPPPPPPPPPSMPAGVAASTPTATRPPRGIFAPTPAPLPVSSPASTAGKPNPAGMRARHTAAPAQSPSRPPAVAAAAAVNASSSATLPLPPRDAGGRWRRKSELPYASAPASASAATARPDPSPYSRQPAQLDPHSHPARKHLAAPSTSTPTAATAGHVGSPPLTPTHMHDTPSLPKSARSTRPPPASPHAPTFPSAAGAGLVQLPPARTRARTASTSSSLSDAPAADRSAAAMHPMYHPTPSSSDELTDPATSSSSSDADADVDEHDQDISSDTCALCNRQSVPSPSKLPAIVSQSPFPQPASLDPSSSAPSASTKKSVTHWAGCDFCPRWYHCACLGVPHRIVSKLAKLACPVCAAEHAHACKVKEKEAKRVAEQVGAWVKQVYAARMAKGRPVPTVAAAAAPAGKPKAAKSKVGKRGARRSVTPRVDEATGHGAASMLSEPVVAYAVRDPAGVMVYMDKGAAGVAELPRLGQGQGDVIALPPLTRRGRTKSVEKIIKPGMPGRSAYRSHIRGHAVHGAGGGYVPVESGASAPATDAESGSGSEADTDGECEQEGDDAEEGGEGDGAEVSECESTYSGSVCSSLFIAGAGYDPMGGADTYYDAHVQLHGFQHYSSALARRSLSPSEATEVEYSCPASPDGAHAFAGYHSHPPPVFTTATSPLDTLLAAANVVAVADAATASSSSMDPSNPLASLASVASMMLLSDDHELKSETSAHVPSDDASHNKLLILADSAWASSLALGVPPASPTGCDPGTEGAVMGQGATQLPPTPVSASESDAGAGGADEGQQAGGPKRSREEGVACTTIAHGAAKRLKTCDAEAMASLARMQVAGVSSTSL